MSPRHTALVALLIFSALGCYGSPNQGSGTEFTADGAGRQGDIALGPDGNVWFATGNGNDPGLGRASPSGAVTVFPLTTVAVAVASGPDGNIWFTEPGFGRPTKIARFLIP